MLDSDSQLWPALDIIGGGLRVFSLGLLGLMITLTVFHGNYSYTALLVGVLIFGIWWTGSSVPVPMPAGMNEATSGSADATGEEPVPQIEERAPLPDSVRSDELDFDPARDRAFS